MGLYINHTCWVLLVLRTGISGHNCSDWDDYAGMVTMALGLKTQSPLQ